MDLFEKIVENPLFLKWIFNPDQQTELYWRTYMKANQEEADFIRQMKSKASNYFGHSRDKLSNQDKALLSSQIKQRLALEDRKDKRKKQVLSFMKYAAVALFFSLISSTIVYFQMHKNRSDFYVQDFSFPAQINEPTLIFSEGESIRLNKSESTLSYRKTGEIVLNGNSVIQSKNVDAGENQVINQLIIPYGNRSKVALSDGTIVWLNAGSRLVYPSVFVEDTREVSLFGEAFFDVTENEDQPFVVKTSALDIKVLGTEFNVSAYADDNTVQTVLKEGRITIRKKGVHLFEKDLVLKPNQLNVFNKHTESSKVYQVDASRYTLWIDGLLQFNDEELNRVIKKVERYYNIRISYTNASLARIKITGKLDMNRDETEVLEYLAKVSRNDYEKVGENMYLIK